MIKLSFIVPVYNVEQYLRKCVDSLLAQDYDDYEIILVDDGSTDNSGFICDEYSTLYILHHTPYTIHHTPKIHVIHQVNSGLSAARNTGIAAAKGEYICFVDSDDYWEPNVLNGLMSQVEKEQLDVLRFDYQNVNENYEIFNPNKSPRYVDKESSVVDGVTYLNTRMGYACYAVMFILRRDLIYTLHPTPYTENNILFSPGLHFEDVDWLPRMMLKAMRVNSTTTTVYNYLIRQGSITKTQGNIEKIRKNIVDQMTVMQNLSQLAVLHPDCSWLSSMRSSMAAGVLTSVAQNIYSEKKEYIQNMYAMHVFPLAIADQGKTYIRRAKLVNSLGPYFFCWIMRLRANIL